MEIHPEAQFRQFLDEGRFMIQRGKTTGTYVFYPRVAEPGTGNLDLEWVEASGRGTVYSRTTIRTRDPAQAYNVSIVQLAEGPRMISRVQGVVPDEVAIGIAVQARIVIDDGAPLVVFEPIFS